MGDWFTISNIDALDTPALVIYADRVRKNLEIVKSFVRDPRQLRPHVKTNKCPQVVRMMLEAGISKFKCATIAEAEMLATENATDVLLAYQPQGPKALRYIALQKKFPHTTFSCLVDHEKTVLELSRLAREHNAQVRVFIDLNVGMNRTGIIPGDAAFALFETITSVENIAFVGLHAYDGHLRDTDLETRRKRCDDAFATVETLRKKIAARGIEPVVIAGGTPTFPIHAKRNGVEPSPGTFIFWDKGYQQILKEQPFEFAALVVTRVISVPAENRICVDLGHKSIASENALTDRVHLLNGADLHPVGHSEEHMVFEHRSNHVHQPGDVFYGVPYHICPTVALHDEAAVVENNRIVGTWPILSRKRKITV